VYGLDTVLQHGLKGRGAVTGDATKHFFIDFKGQLWKLSDTLSLLDYAEFFSPMNSSIVMSYDAALNFVYICDGEYGFVYNAAENSLGKGPVNVTGIGYKSGVQYVAASAVVETDAFDICTDVDDFGSRKSKTLYSIELGTDLQTGLYASIDYRRTKSAAFTQTPWYAVGPTGKAIVIAHGVEFRVRVKTASYESIKLDYIKINGVVNDY
jgi:hypothetical protein